MSVVIAVKTKDMVVLGADSQISCGGYKSTLISSNVMKVWEVAGHPNSIMGGTGALRDLNIAFANESFYDTTRDALGLEQDFKFMVNEFIPNLINLFTEHGRVINECGTVRLNNSSFIFAQNNLCYLIDADGCLLDLTEEGECMAIGSGANVAKSVYESLRNSDLTVEEKIEKALSRACEEDLHCNYPIYLRNTKNPEKVYVKSSYKTKNMIEKNNNEKVEL